MDNSETTPQIIRGERARRRRRQNGSPVSTQQGHELTANPVGNGASTTGQASATLPQDATAESFPSASRLEMVPADEHMDYIGTGYVVC